MTSILTQLKQSFTVYQTPPFPADTVVLTVEGQVIALKADDLSPRETALLAALRPTSADDGPWPRFLAGNGPAPVKGPVRFIYFTTTTDQLSERSVWLDAFTSLFASEVSGFFTSTQTGLLVEPLSKIPTDEDTLTGILDTLDSDFDTNTKIYAGHFWPVDDNLPAIVAEEAAQAASASARVATLQSTALTYYTRDARQHSVIMKALRATINDQAAEMKPVITALYHNQGNLTAAAKALYLHRNTLQYRLDKFQTQTGFSLKQMDDLVLCYLLSQGE